MLELIKTVDKKLYKKLYRRKYQKKYAAKKYLESIEFRVRKMLYAAKSRAKKKQLDFSVTIDDIVVPDVCPIFNEPFNWLAKGMHCSSSPSLDRIDNSKGYVPGNVRIISHRANKIKSNLTYSEITQLYENFHKIF